MKTTLLNILKGIIESDHCDETLADLDAIERYAKFGCGRRDITREQAEKIHNAGKSWRASQDRGEYYSQGKRAAAAMLGESDGYDDDDQSETPWQIFNDTRERFYTP